MAVTVGRMTANERLKLINIFRKKNTIVLSLPTKALKFLSSSLHSRKKHDELRRLPEGNRGALRGNSRCFRGVSLGLGLFLFCFSKDDAEALLSQVTLIDPHARQGSKVVPVALNKVLPLSLSVSVLYFSLAFGLLCFLLQVFQLKVNSVAFRLIPEFSQVKNALKEREKSGFASSGFSGVPVFQEPKPQAPPLQSRNLILKSQSKRFRPLFSRKEDLENTLKSAAREQNKLNSTMRKGDIQVATLEDVIKEMKENSTSNWDDVIFIPPGFDVSDDSNEQ
ncbi:Protein TIC 22-like, chloroplastic [Glycine max]|nr:Protein TIC 22-like, chloroplastic [Glycine max]